MTPDWDRPSIIKNLAPFGFSADNALSEEEIRYCSYYGIDFFRSHPNVEQKLGYIPVLQFNVAIHYFSQPSPRGTVLVMHGYFDHVGLYNHLIRYLIEHKYDVVAFDLPGHGLSTGEPAAIKSFAHYQSVLLACLRLLKSQVAMPLHAVAQSTGAAILTDYYLTLRHDRENGAFDKVVFMAPLVRPFGWKSSVVLLNLLRPFFKTWKRVFRDNSNDTTFLSFLRERDPLQAQRMSVDWVIALKRWIGRIERSESVDMPLVIIQGERDGTVDWRHNVVVLSRKFPDTRVFYMKDAEHHLVNESENIRAKMFAIISRTLAEDA